MTTEALWTFALAVYRRPGVEAALLELQDDHGQCVPYLLWALWLGSSGRPADEAVLAAGAARANAWQAAAIAPLRAIRRGLRQPLAGADPQSQTRLRESVKALELDAERLLLEMLEAASPAPGAGGSSSATLAQAIAAWGGAVPPELVRRIADLAA